MFNMMRADTYRLVHGRYLLVMVVALTFCAVFSATMVWLPTTSSFAGLDTAVSDLTMTRSELVAEPQPMLMLFSTCVVVDFAMSDTRGSFLKSLFAQRGRRGRYCLGRACTAVWMCALCLAVYAVASEVACRALGFEIVPEDAGAYAAFMGVQLLSMVAYAMLGLLVAWAARKDAASVAFAIVGASTVLGHGVSFVLGLLDAVLPGASELVVWLPSWGFMSKLLGDGAGALFAAPDVAGLPAVAHLALVYAAWALGAYLLGRIMVGRKDAA